MAAKDGAMSITDSIDNAIWDYGVGPDAMRWSPEDPNGDLPRQAIATFRLDDDFIDAFEFDPGHFVEAFERAREAMQELGETLGAWFDETKRLTSPEDQARHGRLRRMHSAHPAKWRKTR
jgi:hypothetical protein